MVAVVSWPAGEQRQQLVGDVVVGHRRAVFVAALQQHREHVVPRPRSWVRAGPVDELCDDRVVARRGISRNSPHGLHGPSRAAADGHHGQSRAERDHRAGAARAVRRSSSPSAPNTARRMALSVIRIIGVQGLELSALAARCAHPRASPPLRRSPRTPACGVPWNGGTSSLRRCRCSSPSRLKIDPGPSIRPEVGLRVAGDVGAGGEEFLDQRRVADHRSSCRRSAG